MQTVKFIYSGSNTRKLTVSGREQVIISGDGNATKFVFVIPSAYQDYDKFIRWGDFYIEASDGTPIVPEYQVTDNTFTIPPEITNENAGKEIYFQLVFYERQEGQGTRTIVETSLQYPVYVSPSAYRKGVPSYMDVLSRLIQTAYVNTWYDVDQEQDRPVINFQTLDGADHPLVLNMPYLDENNKIPDEFISTEISVEVLQFANVAEMMEDTSAQPPDIAIITEGTSGSEIDYPGNIFIKTRYETQYNGWWLAHSKYTQDQIAPIYQDISDLESNKVDKTTKVNGTAFGNNTEITTAKWGTARTITVKDNDSTNSQTNSNIDGSQDFDLKLPSTIKASITGDVTGGLTGNVTGNVTGNLIGNVTGDVTGNVSGNAGTATKWQTKRKIGLSGVTATQQDIDGSQNVTIPISQVPSSLLSGTIDKSIIPNHADANTTYGVGSTSQYGHVKVDNAMSSTSTNPVQNNVVMDFVNSSIGTATANFLGTYDAHDDLGLTIVDPTDPTNAQIATALSNYITSHSIAASNNDYAFVQMNFPQTVDVDEYRRFKYSQPSPPTAGTWEYEYTLNNSSFTQAQWDSINSLITNTSSPKVGVDVKDINAHLGSTQNPHNVTQSQVGLGNVTNVATTSEIASGSNENITSGAVYTALGDGSVTKIGTADVGTDTKPIKLVGGAPTVVTNDLVDVASAQTVTGLKTFAQDGFAEFILKSANRQTSNAIARYVIRNSADVPIVGIGGAYSNNRSSAILYAIDGADSNTLSRIDIIRDTTSNTGWATAPTREYNANNTTDIVTIGSLQASTDVVHTTGKETIGGNKTFSGQVTNTVASGGYIVKSTDQSLTTAPSNNRFTSYDFKGTDDISYAQFGIASRTNGNREIYLQTSATNNSFKVLRLIAQTNDVAFVTIPYRPYASATDFEALTKGHVPAIISANVGNGQISLTSSRGTNINSFTTNQSANQNIILPASSTQYQNQQVTFLLQSTPDYPSYPYRASFAITGLTSDIYASVVFSDVQASSGNYASFCVTSSGELYMYANADVGTVSIPTISVGMDDSQAQQSMSDFVALNGDQTINDVKTFTSNPKVANPASGAVDTSVVNANWVSQTGEGKPNNLLHDSGDESSTGIKKFEAVRSNQPFMSNVSPMSSTDASPTAWHKMYSWTASASTSNQTLLFKCVFRQDTDGYYETLVNVRSTTTTAKAERNNQSTKIRITRDDTKMTYWVYGYRVTAWVDFALRSTTSTLDDIPITKEDYTTAYDEPSTDPLSDNYHAEVYTPS